MLPYLVLIHSVGTIALFIAIIYILQQTPSRVQNILLVLTVSSIIMMLGYLLEITATTRTAALVGVKVGYLGKPFAAMSALLFVLCYYGYKLNKYVIPLLTCVHALITLLVLTCEQHNLFYTSIAFVYDGLFPRLSLGHGVFYYIYTGLLLCYMAANMVIAFVEFRKASIKSEKAQVFLVFGLIASGIVGFVFFLSGVTGGYDTTILGCFIGSVFLYILFSAIAFSTRYPLSRTGRWMNP